MSKPSYGSLLLSLLNNLLFFKTRLLFRKTTNEHKLFNHYRNIFSIISNIDTLSLTKPCILVEKYFRSVGYLKEYYDLEEAEYISIHGVLRKALAEEVNILRIQGASSIYSRMLFLLASLNYLVLFKPELARYSLQLNNILSMPVPPQADEAKILDLLKPGEEITFIPGNIYSAWALEILIKDLISQGYRVKLLVCNEEFELNINKNNVLRYWRQIIDKEGVELVFINCYKGLLSTNSSVVVVLNNLLIFHILDKIGELTDHDNAILVFNPMYTVLQEILGSTPIVISISSLRNILFRRYNM